MIPTEAQLRRRIRLIRLLHWEYWPSWAYYFPMFVYYPWQALKARHLCFFTAANPGIYTGGMGMESKYETLMKIPAKWRPKTILALPGETTASLSLRLAKAGIEFPLIAKPDMGLRGFLVSKIHDHQALQNLLEKHPVSFVLQEFISKKNEFGVFYHRFPDEEQGHVTSLTFKEFLHVVGNGRDTLWQLISAHTRALLQWERLSKTYAGELERVPSAGEIVPLGEIGNHSKGTRFINAASHIDDTLRESFDRISRHIEGFHYGRFDIKCDSFEELRQGENLTILELNGVCSEPTHIYDEQTNTYGYALREIIRHWDIVYRMGTALHRRGVPYLPAKKMVAEFRALGRQLRRQG